MEIFRLRGIETGSKPQMTITQARPYYGPITIVGDAVYGSSTKLKDGLILLHHTSLTFPHPTQGKDIVITSTPKW